MSYLRYYTPVGGREPFREARRSSLNFETRGGERHSSLDTAAQPLATLYRFPEKASGTVLTRIRGKEMVMPTTEEGPNETSATRGGGQSRSENHRADVFSARGPIQAKINSRSGDVTVRVGDGDRVEVVLRASSRQHEYLLDAAVVTFDADRGELEVRTRDGDQFDSFRNLKGMMKRRTWFEFGSSDLDVEVTLPRDSAVDLTTISGDARLFGSLGDVDVSEISGDVLVDDDVQSLNVRTASGDVRVTSVLERLDVKTASGDVRCDDAARKTSISSASGDVHLTAARPGELVVRAVSGDVVVHVARGLAVDVNGNTVSGDLGSNINLDALGDAADDDETIFIKVTTVSGDVRINKAS